MNYCGINIEKLIIDNFFEKKHKNIWKLKKLYLSLSHIYNFKTMRTFMSYYFILKPYMKKRISGIGIIMTS